MKTQIWKNSDGIIYHDNPIESFILYFTTGEKTDNTASHQKQETTKYVIEKISTENSESDIPQILYGHGEFSLTSNLIESSNQGFKGEYNVNFRACCWDNSVYNLTNPEIKLRRVFRINLSNQVKYQ